RGMDYPDNDFANRMKFIASLINSRNKARVYYVTLPGFDTHVAQRGAHDKLLKTYGDTLKHFCDDVKIAGRWNDTILLTFSEFGRSVAEDANQGTDHGAANIVFIAGGNLKKAGVLNAAPDLQNLDNGDLVYNIDFRSVYATILNNWLGVDSSMVLGRQ